MFTLLLRFMRLRTYYGAEEIRMQGGKEGHLLSIWEGTE